MRSKLENFKPESIRTIMRKIDEDLTDESMDVRSYSDPEYSDFFYEIEQILSNLGMPSEIQDVNFILKCFEDNPNFSNSDEPLKIPKIRTFIVNHTVTRDVRLVENMSQEIDSYLDMTEYLVDQYQELDQFFLYDGEITDTEYLDSDWVNDEIDSIYEK